MSVTQSLFFRVVCTTLTDAILAFHDILRNAAAASSVEVKNLVPTSSKSRMAAAYSTGWRHPKMASISKKQLISSDGLWTFRLQRLVHPNQKEFQGMVHNQIVHDQIVHGPNI